MDDFTKEELRLLFGGLSLFMEEIYPENDRDREFRNDLYKKMQTMIDNYCDYKCNHESDGLIYTSNPPKKRCKKCREFYR